MYLSVCLFFCLYVTTWQKIDHAGGQETLFLTLFGLNIKRSTVSGQFFLLQINFRPL